MRRLTTLTLILLSASLGAVHAMGPPVQGSPGFYHGVDTGQGGQGNDFASGLALMRQERYSDAIPYLARAHSDSPHNAEVLNFLGYAHYKIGDDDLALEFLTRALNEDPDDKLAHQFLGELYLSTKDLPSAQAQLAELVKLCPDSCETRGALASEIATYQLQNGNTPVATKPAGAN